MGNRRAFEERATQALAKHFSGDGKLMFPEYEQSPLVSIILVVANKTPLVFACLQSILEFDDCQSELIISNNSTSIEMRRLLSTISGAIIVENNGNIGFVKAVNKAAAVARGKYILLLNDDATLTTGSISRLVDVIENDEMVGAVGGKIVMLDGKLQEAGSIIWNDGTGHGYGRGEDPEAGEFNFRRDVDYCSGCFVLTPRAMWNELGGFDEAFSPGYYEETDYSMRVWKAGYRIVYEPRAWIVHYEYGTNNKERATALMTRNRPIFIRKHKQALQNHFKSGTALHVARSRNKPKGRVLVIDDRVPHPSLGSGYPRAAEMLRTIHDAGYDATFWGMAQMLLVKNTWGTIRETIPDEVEVLTGPGNKLTKLLQERRNFYDTVIVSREHNMRAFYHACGDATYLYQEPRLIYDAEAITCLRTHEYVRLRGQLLNLGKINTDIKKEVRLAVLTKHVFAVSESEAAVFRRFGAKNVSVLGHSLTPAKRIPGFDERRDFVFCGALHTNKSPNVDSLVWFALKCWGRIRSQLPDARLLVAGLNTASDLSRVHQDSIEFLGRISDAQLDEVLAAGRVFIAPTRFAAGIPHKCHNAAAHGMPIVATPLLARQLAWEHGKEIYAAKTEQEWIDACVTLYTDGFTWRSMRDWALARVALDCSPTKFRETLLSALDAGQ